MAVFPAIAQCPSHLRCIGFCPPAVQFRKIDIAIETFPYGIVFAPCSLKERLDKIPGAFNR